MNIDVLIGRLLLSLGAAAIPAVMLHGTAASAGPGAAAPPGGSASYSCQGDSEATPAQTPVTFALIGTPTAVRPGDHLSLSGNLGMTLSDAAAERSQLELAENAKIDATDFNLVVKVGGRTISLEPSSVVSTLTKIKTPFELSANVSYPEVKIPDSATGAVVVRMPVARTASTEVAGAPEKVTFTTHLLQDSPLFPGRNFACWTDDLGRSATVAKIPIEPLRAAGPETSAGPPATPVPSAPGQPATGALAATVPAPMLDPLPPADLPPAAAPPAAAPVSTALAAAAIPPATDSGRTFIPGWMLVLTLAILPAAAIALAVLQRKRLQRLTAMTATSG